MYLYRTYEGEQAREFVHEPLPAGGEWPEVQQRVHTVQVWASNVDDPGADHYVLVAYDAAGHEIGRKQVHTY